jgi:predicted permease
MLKDVFRQLRVAPGISAVAVLSIGLGIAATSAVYSVANALLFDLYPYRQPDRLVRYVGQLPARAFENLQKLEVFEGAIATDFYNMSLTDGDLPEAVKAARLSPNAFEFFGVPAFLGHEFASADSPSGQEPEHAVVLSYGFWRRHYNGDRGVIGKVLELDHVKYAVIGVVPPSFRWYDSDVFLPANLAFFNFPTLEVHGRIRDGITWPQAQAQLMAFMKTRIPNMPPDFVLPFRRLTDEAKGNFQQTVVLCLIAVLMLLAVGCANVSILLLARGTARQREFAILAALGASRQRLAAQLLMEALALTLTGALFGILLAWASVTEILRWLPSGTLPAEADIQISPSVLLLSVVTALVTGIIAGVAPVFRLPAGNLNQLITGARTATTPTHGRKLQYALVAAQVSLSVLLLAGAGAAIRSLLELYRTTLGFETRDVLRLTIPTPEGSYRTFEERKAVFQDILARITAKPSIEFAALSDSGRPPLGGTNRPIEVFGEATDSSRRAAIHAVSEDFFTVFRIPLEAGRVWSGDETGRAAPVAVINREMARRLSSGGDLLGRKIRIPNYRPGLWTVAPAWSSDWLEIVGVVGNTIGNDFRQAPPAAIYVPYSLMIGDNLSLVLRSRNAAEAVRFAREQIHAAAPGQAIGPMVQTAADLLREAGWGRQEFLSSLFAFLAVFALLLAAIGLYSAVSYTTSLHLHEFGIRMALGAGKLDVMRVVLRSAALSVGIGVLAGLALILAIHSTLSKWTTVNVNDPLVLVAIVTLLSAVVALAVLLPVRRAVSVEIADLFRW